jgi:membrane protein implicated in regulation of membrane protease activity
MSLDQAFFLGIALVGSLFLFVSFIIGEVGDFFDDVGDAVGDQLAEIGIGEADAAHEGIGGDTEGPSPLSLRNLMAFLTAYGASGLITSVYGWSTLASSLFALFPGTVIAFIAYQLMNALYRQQASSIVEVGQLLGSSGVVEISIPAGGVGRVTVSTDTGTSSFIARSRDGDMISTGSRVVVAGNLGSELIVTKAQPS